MVRTRRYTNYTTRAKLESVRHIAGFWGEWYLHLGGCYNRS